MIENSKNIVPNDNSQKNKKKLKKDSSWLKDENHSVLKKLKERDNLNILITLFFYLTNNPTFHHSIASYLISLLFVANCVSIHPSTA